VAKADLISLPLAPAIDRAPVNDCRRARAAADVPRRPSPASSNDAWQMAPRPPFEFCAPLQAGGAFGAYPTGAYEVLAEAIRHPNGIAGTSIGAVDGAFDRTNMTWSSRAHHAFRRSPKFPGHPTFAAQLADLLA
jgi:hypothetical protein